jgi:hypothetical protein
MNESDVAADPRPQLAHDGPGRPRPDAGRGRTDTAGQHGGDDLRWSVSTAMVGISAAANASSVCRRVEVPGGVERLTGGAASVMWEVGPARDPG